MPLFCKILSRSNGIGVVWIPILLEANHQYSASYTLGRKANSTPNEDAVWHLLLGKVTPVGLQRVHFLTTESKIPDACNYFTSILCALESLGKLYQPERLSHGPGCIYVINLEQDPVPVSKESLADTVEVYREHESHRADYRPVENN
jgi:hypothetical protein